MKRWKGFAAVAVLAAVAAGVAYATIPDSESVIHGCYGKSGNLRVIDPSTGGGCTAGETPLEWSQKGQRGEQGPPGPPGPAAPPADAIHATVAITGQKQGAFSQTPIPVVELSHEIVSPRDPASGLPTGKRQHKPLKIVMELGRTTPMILSALVNNENLPSVKLSITDGTSNTVMTVELVNASVAQWTQSGDHGQVSFTYQKIVWTWVDGGVTAQDDWEAPVA